jgi:hypothetical protein
MKPSLVEYEKIFKKKAAPIEVQINPKSIPVQIDNYHFFFNVFSIIIVNVKGIKKKTNGFRHNGSFSYIMIQIKLNKFESIFFYINHI